MSRNDIFSSTGEELPVERQTVEQLHQELGFDIPVETVPLPSLGKVYPEAHPLHMAQTVDIRAMTAREEDILTSRALLKSGDMVSRLINSCLIDKSVDPDTLLAGDRNAILTAIRITGYGADYSVNINCPSCGTSQVHQSNLTELPIRSLTQEPVAPGLNEFEVILPASGKRVNIRFTTGYAEKEAQSTDDRKKKQGFTSESTVTDSLFRSIVSIDGNTDKSYISKFVRNMPAKDSLAARMFVSLNEPTVLMRSYFECRNCDHEEELPLPIGANFLWPWSRG
jgi:hypothetical protein